MWYMWTAARVCGGEAGGADEAGGELCRSTRGGLRGLQGTHQPGVRAPSAPGALQVGPCLPLAIGARRPGFRWSTLKVQLRLVDTGTSVPRKKGP